MGREVPGSSFERRDGEDRTWDEMVWWEQPFESDEDLVFDDDDDIERESNDPTSIEDWVSERAEPTSLAVEWWLLRDIDDRVAELDERIYYRNMAATAGEAIDTAAAASDDAEFATLVAFRKRHPDPEAGADDAAPTAELASTAARDVSAPTLPTPVSLVETAIKEKLTEPEFLHWQELLKGTRQDVIAQKLGIKQSAVSKRERRLRERVDAISVETVGRPYPERLVDRGLWARQGRRRNKRAPRQR